VSGSRSCCLFNALSASPYAAPWVELKVLKNRPKPSLKFELIGVLDDFARRLANQTSIPPSCFHLSRRSHAHRK